MSGHLTSWASDIRGPGLLGAQRFGGAKFYKLIGD